jgi:predicted RNA-binding protein with PUA-like domain
VVAINRDSGFVVRSEQPGVNRVKAFSDDGILLDANFDIETSTDGFDLILRSRSGSAHGPSAARNSDYDRVLELLFSRLGKGGAELRMSSVDSRPMRLRPFAERQIVMPNYPYPIALGDIEDIHQLRLDMGRVQAGISHASDATGNNRNKQLRLSFGFPNPWSQSDLEKLLVGTPAPSADGQSTHPTKSNIEAAGGQPGESGQSVMAGTGSGYWAFVCNPKKWAIDRFLASGKTIDTWGVRKSDASHFAPGQLAIVRVGVDRRSSAERNGAPPLVPGIYAICRIESRSFPATGAVDEFWQPGSERQPGWPTVSVRYLHRFAASPLSIDRLRNEGAHQPKLLIDGFQASSFPITEHAFAEIVELLGLDPDQYDVGVEGDVVNHLDLSSLWERYKDAPPIVRERISRQYERGPVGSLVKKANGYRCQLCEALGVPWTNFLKPDGSRYIEAHHVALVSTKSAGVLSPSNVITVCPNHHRQLHYGCAAVEDHEDEFQFAFDEQPPIRIQKFQKTQG